MTIYDPDVEYEEPEEDSEFYSHGGRQHVCPGDDCGYCENRIAAREYERDYGDRDMPNYYDGTGRY